MTSTAPLLAGYRLKPGSKLHSILRCAALDIRRGQALESLEMRPGTWSRYTAELRRAGLITSAPSWGLTPAGAEALASLDS